MDLENLLKLLNKQQLISLVLRIYGKYSYINDVIDQYVEEALNDQAGKDEEIKLFHDLQNRIQSFTDGNDLVDWQSVYGFAEDLNVVISDINVRMRQQSPEQALSLIELLLDSCETVLSYCDDSDGEIVRVFKGAMDIWLDVAAQVRYERNEDNTDWVAKVLFYFDHNEYGCYDDVISRSRVLLSDEELQQLARQFEKQLQLVLNSEAESSPILAFRRNTSLAMSGLKSVAEAMDDVALFEKAAFMSAAEITEVLMQSVVEFAVSAGDYERAQYWLDQPGWSSTAGIHKQLTVAVLKARGDIARVKDAFIRDFNSHQDYASLSAYWIQADSEEREQLRHTVTAIALAKPEITEAISMLLLIGNVQAAGNIMVNRVHELRFNDQYQTLQWLQKFEQYHQPLAMIICYRKLLEHILNQQLTQAYGQAIIYFRRLWDLDGENPDYQGLTGHREYVQRLQNLHWRQRGFWKRTGCFLERRHG